MRPSDHEFVRPVIIRVSLDLLVRGRSLTIVLSVIFQLQYFRVSYLDYFAKDTLEKEIVNDELIVSNDTKATPLAGQSRSC